MRSASQKPFVQRVLACTCVLQSLLVFFQGIFAGNFLSGDDGAVALHEIGGWSAFIVALVQAGLAMIVPGRTRSVWFLVSSFTVAVAEMLQLGTGYGHYLQVHIPLAILVVGILIWQIVWIMMEPKLGGAPASP